MDIRIRKVNEVFLSIECIPGIEMEIKEYFSFYAHNYKFMPKYRCGMWDGKIYLFKNGLLYVGLLEKLYEFAIENKYTINTLDEPLVSPINLSEYIEKLNLPFPPRDYQITSIYKTITEKRILLLSATGSGKSLYIYCMTRYLQSSGKKKGLLLVPTVSLVNQMYKDFDDYGWQPKKHCHMIYSGQEKSSNSFLDISTWQSIYKMPKRFFEKYDFLIIDECHQAKALSLVGIAEKCVNADYRIGTTGTLDGLEINKLTLEGLLGPVFKATSTSKLIEKGQLCKLKIECVVLKYPDNITKGLRGITYQDEMNFIISNQARNQFIKNLAGRLKNNTLILFQYVEKHGDQLFKILQELRGKKVFYVHGGTKPEIREEIRAITEVESNVIILASYGVYSTGINIKNLDNIIYASSSKSRIRNLQSIGRGLRLNKGKEFATLYDISDDLRYGRYINHTLKHMKDRVKIYSSEKFPFKIHQVTLTNP